jgi:Septum formation
VPCTAVHAYEVVGFSYLDETLWPPQAYPDPASLQDVADARCRTYLEDYMYGAGEDVTAYDVTAKLPPAADWESGDRSVICFGYPIGSGANDKPLAGDPSSSLGGADA